MSGVFNPRTLVDNKGPVIDFTIIAYGSKPGDPKDDREGQRRVEIAAHPRLPRDNMTDTEINEFCSLFLMYQWQDIKHNNYWHCEFCGKCLDQCRPSMGMQLTEIVDKPTRNSKTKFVSTAHLERPVVCAYVRLSQFIARFSPTLPFQFLL